MAGPTAEAGLEAGGEVGVNSEHWCSHCASPSRHGVFMLSLVWFKRDLRVTDHPALALAAAQGDVLPVHIVEPGL